MDLCDVKNCNGTHHVTVFKDGQPVILCFKHFKRWLYKDFKYMPLKAEWGIF